MKLEIEHEDIVLSRVEGIKECANSKSTPLLLNLGERAPFFFSTDLCIAEPAAC